MPGKHVMKDLDTKMSAIKLFPFNKFVLHLYKFLKRMCVGCSREWGAVQGLILFRVLVS